MDALELASEGASKSKGGLNMPDVRARVRESLPHHCQLTLTLSDSWQFAARRACALACFFFLKARLTSACGDTD